MISLFSLMLYLTSLAKSRKSTSISASLIDYSSAEEEQSNTKTDDTANRRRTSTSSRNSNTSRNTIPSNHIPSTPSKQSVRNSSRSNTPQQSKRPATRQVTNGVTNNGLARHTPQHTLPFHRNSSSNETSNLNGRRSTRQGGLIHFSENEDEESEEEAEEEESDEDEDEEDVDDEDLEDDEEEELEDEEHSYDEEDEDDEDHFTGGVNLGIQTSPGLDDTVDSGNLNGGGARFRSTGNSNSSRFISSTPTPSVKSTSAYFASTQHPPDSSLCNNGKTKPAFPINSPLRRHVAGNTKAFGSLGEVLASLPMSGQRPNTGLSLPSSTWSNIPSSSSTSSYSQALSFTSPATTSNSYIPTVGGTPVSAADLTTQVGRTAGHNSSAQNPVSGTGDGYNMNNRSRYCNSQNISKLIIVMAGFFFLVLSYKYATLRPSIDIERLVCETEDTRNDAINPNVHLTCVPKELENAVTNITRDLVNILEARGVEIICSENTGETKNSSVSMSEILQELLGERAEETSYKSNEEDLTYASDYDLRSNGFESEAHIDKIDEDDEDLEESTSTKEASKDISSLGYRSLMDKASRTNIQLVLTLIYENPQWGIKIIRDTSQESLKTAENDMSINMEDEEEEKIGEDKQENFPFDTTYLSVVHLPISWKCWFRLWTIHMYSLLLTLLIYLIYVALVLLVVYVAYRIYCWRQEKQIREQQDVFELVEQVLSMLVTQHQQYHALAVAANANASQTGTAVNVTGKPCLAVNHIRDQLIPPTVSTQKLK